MLKCEISILIQRLVEYFPLTDIKVNRATSLTATSPVAISLNILVIILNVTYQQCK